MNMDKVPLEKLVEGENGDFAYLDRNKNPIMVISKSEYANAEKINQLIDWCRELQEEVFKLKNV